MARLPIIVPEEAKGKVRGLLADIRKKLGLVPNMARVIANSPARLEAYIQFSSALEGGSLDAKCRERIALRTTEANRCKYCLSAHSAIGKMVGLDDSEILDSRQAHSKDPKANAALRFSRLILEEHGAVGAADIEAARKGGLTESEIAEMVGLTVLNIFTNYFSTAFQVEIDFPHP
ncbi:MAG: carboxymuconolactone decarboxylase family protein [Candidatus Acidiferrales bacterium]